MMLWKALKGQLRALKDKISIGEMIDMGASKEKINSFEENYANNRIMLKDEIPLELPLCISFEASGICNFKCVMCHHGNLKNNSDNRAMQNLPMPVLTKCVEELQNWCRRVGRKVKLIKLYSLGEPLVNPNIVSMVRIIKEADICDALEITSNSSLLSENVAKGLVDYGLDIYRASIYSVDEKRNAEITQSIFKPETIRNNIMRMKEYRDKQGKEKPFISAKMIDSYSDENERFMQNYEGVADEAYIDKIMDISGDGETLKRYYRDNSEKAFHDEERTRISKHYKSCRYPFTHMTVTGNGKVVVCCADWNMETLIGDVNNNTLQEIWNSKELYDFRCMTLLTKGQGNKLCKKCEIPLRGYPEDDIEGVDINRFTYWK